MANVALSRGSKWFVGFIVLALAGVGGLLLYLDGRLGGNDIEPGLDVELVVEPGDSVRAVSEQLADEGVVGSATRFRSAAADAELDRRLQPGAYDLVTGMSPDEAVEVLLDGPARSAGVRFTIQEGLPVELILGRLDEQFDEYSEEDFRAVLDERTEAGGNEEGVLQLPDWAPEPAEAGEEVIEPYEGLLFPETYEVGQDATPQDVLQMLLNQTASVMDRLVEESGDEDVDRYELLIEASLIERETRVDEERSRVAGVIQNRIDDGMRLQVDATVLYARGEHVERVLIEDTEIDSPYNTYQSDGLPPAPIAAPGAAALQAGLSPEDHDFRYYVLSDECDGTHRFAETLDEHQAFVAEFRAVDNCQ
jgi:UPF0755 protein